MINMDILEEAFAEAQNDMQVLVAQAKEEFFRPETEREAASLWLKMPPLMKSAIYAQNPKLANRMDRNVARMRGEQINGTN